MNVDLIPCGISRVGLCLAHARSVGAILRRSRAWLPVLQPKSTTYEPNRPPNEKPRRLILETNRSGGPATSEALLA